MGEFHDLGRARRDHDSKRGLKPEPIEQLADALGLRGDKPTRLTAADLDQLATSTEVDEGVRNTARQISDLLHQRPHEIVEDQAIKEE